MAEHRAHSLAFVAVVRTLVAASPGPAGRDGSLRLADVGSGAGVPGLILAQELPDVSVTLIDRREGRAAWLEEAGGALGDEGISVRVCCAEVYDLAHGGDRGRFDLVTARAFGPPAVTAELGGALLGVGGRLVVSEPPDRPDRWEAVDGAGLGLVDEGPVQVGRGTDGGAGSSGVGFRVLVRRSPLAAGRPRRRPRP